MCKDNERTQNQEDENLNDFRRILRWDFWALSFSFQWHQMQIWRTRSIWSTKGCIERRVHGLLTLWEETIAPTLRWSNANMYPKKAAATRTATPVKMIQKCHLARLQKLMKHRKYSVQPSVCRYKLHMSTSFWFSNLLQLWIPPYQWGDAPNIFRH